MNNKVLSIVVMLIFSITNLNSQVNRECLNFCNALAKSNELKEIYKYCFMTEEFVYLCKTDTSIINHSIFKRENYVRTQGEEYYYDMSINMLKKKLEKLSNIENQKVIEKIFATMTTQEMPSKPNINWGKVFETCQNCYFGTYPADRFTYFNFSLIFMTEEEINEMINYEEGVQWKYALMAIKGGDSFALNKSQNGNNVLDKRIAIYIIDRWKGCNLPEVQELIATLEYEVIY